MLSDLEPDGSGTAGSLKLRAMATLAPARYRPEPAAPGSSDGTGPGRTTRGWPRWVIRPILIYLASRLVTMATLAVTGWVTHRSIVAEVDRWDSVWFVRAAAHGWPTQIPYHHGYVAGSTIAFLPVFPLTIRWVSTLTGMSLLATGMVDQRGHWAHRHHRGVAAGPPLRRPGHGRSGHVAGGGVPRHVRAQPGVLGGPGRHLHRFRASWPSSGAVGSWPECWACWPPGPSRWPWPSNSAACGAPTGPSRGIATGGPWPRRYSPRWASSPFNSGCGSTPAT